MKTRALAERQIVLQARLRKQIKSKPVNDGLVEWLLACPHKGFFVRIESDSTDRFNQLHDRFGTASFPE